MISIIRGSFDNGKYASIDRLVNYFKGRQDIDGVLYFGYPIIGTIEGAFNIDAMLVSKNHGIIVFDIVEGGTIVDRQEIQDNIYSKIESNLLQHKELVNKRKLLVKFEVVTYAPVWDINGDNEYGFNVASTDDQLTEFLECNLWENSEYYNRVLSVIQAVTTIKTGPKRENVTKPNSRGSKLKRLEETIANLDQYQNAAVIETAEGPQKIRGLAGSGKTIVLALKVAYLHATHPDWVIAVTFNTRSLKNQFYELITRFTIAQKREEPDWNRVKIIHAWGNSSATGIYYELCMEHGIKYYDFKSAQSELSLSYGDEFEKVCEKALGEITAFKEKYDVILVDEAQDFSDSFLRICYNILKAPKRLIWAFDELQKLNEVAMKSEEEIFGYNENGDPRVRLENLPDKPKQDIILQTCYRNSRPVLVTAHALGFGVYRENGLVQMFGKAALWNEIGYEIKEGSLIEGKKVILGRTTISSPAFLEEHSEKDDLIVFKKFSTNEEQLEWIADQIEKNLSEDELQYKDIIVIHSNPLKTPKVVGPLRELLYKRKINSHLAGVDTSPDDFFRENSITFTSIFRAKGNEAAMIYLFDSQYCYSGAELIKKRNTLFTAITRSKAWVRVCGFGDAMKLLEDEYLKVRDRGFTLDFTYPTEEQRKHMNIVNREMAVDEKKAIKQQEENLGTLLKLLQDNKIYKQDLSPEIIEALRKELLE